jgi:hypothetical protein
LWYVYSRPCGKHSGLTPIAVRKAFGLESMIGMKETAKELNKAI